nr:TonB-dependent receptor [uncultured Carboxylicivirga sp.]
MKKIHELCAWDKYAIIKTLRVMRLTILFMMIGVMQMFATSTYSQKTRVTLDLTNTSIAEVLLNIEDQSEFYFLYNRKLVDVERKVNISMKKSTIDNVLNEIFDGTDTEHQVIDRRIILAPSSLNENQQETITVSGTVKDGNDDPLPGVSIVIKGTSNGTITDMNGQYSLKNVPTNATLIFSFIGMESQEVIVNGQEQISIILQESTYGMDEVIVVGYGTQKKSDITGSVASVSSERLSKIPVSNVMQAVQGSVAGVVINQVSSIPGTAPNITVRGGGSITASTDPYVVVDGVPITKMGGSINDINPNDIESIEILKDASAVAIYGMNGANGVILITTKRGQSGKPTIRYSGYMGIEHFAHIPEMVSPEELIARYKEGNRINGSPMYHDQVKYEYEVENYENSSTIDWIDAVSQTGIQQNHNISISGANESLTYYISGDILDQKGVVKGYNYKRYSLRTNLEANVTDYLKVGTNSTIVAHNRDGGRANLLNAEAMSPYGRMYEDDGSYTIYPMFGETLWSNPLLPTTTDPERRQFNVNINGYADLDFGKIWTPLSGLTYKLNAGYSYIPRRTSSYTGETVNDLLGTAQIWHYETQAYTIENILGYSKDIAKHHLDLTAVYSAQERNYNENWSRAQNFVNDELEWNRMQAGATSSVSSYADRYAAVSQMGRLNYSFDSRYLFTFTVRRDGSSVFSEGLKYGTFPSVALGWNLHHENFFSGIEAINNMKLRLSYGTSGNEAVSVYKTFTTMSDVQIALGGETNIAMVANQLGNSDLSWESKKSLNIGVDFGFLRNRINGTLDVYSDQNLDLLLSRKLPAASGFSEVTANIGETKSKGLELTLNTVNIATSDFKWSSSIVYASNKNEIVELYGDGEDDLGSGWFIGEPIGVIRDFQKVGIWQEDEIAAGDHLDWDPVAKPGDVKLADISGPDGIPDGVIDDNDRIILGQTSPKWTGGFTNTFTYKNWTLNVFIQTVQGAMRNNHHIGMASDELERRNSLAEIGYWTPDNKSNEWRSLNKNSNPHGYGFPVKNNYTRIKDVTLNYEFSKEITNRIGIDALNVYVSGRNLFTFTDWIGWDPEERSDYRGTGNWEINYPSVRTIVCGINLTL